MVLLVCGVGGEGDRSGSSATDHCCSHQNGDFLEYALFHSLKAFRAVSMDLELLISYSGLLGYEWAAVFTPPL